MRARTAPEYCCRLNVVAPEELVEAVKASADARMTSINSWVRQACLLALAKETVESKNETGRSSEP
jgi:hypothetical protein